MKRAIATDYIPGNLWACDSVYAYGTNTTSPASTKLVRCAHGTRTLEEIYDFTSTYHVANGKIFTTDVDGEVFAVLYDASNYYTLWRSSNYGVTFAQVFDFSAGGTVANRYTLDRGLCVGYPGGARTYLLAEYYTDSGAQACRLLTSMNGTSWTIAASVTGGTAGNIRHWHCVAWNPYTEKWCIGSGDTDAQNIVMTTANLALITDSAPSALVAIAGISGSYGTQHHRTVDFLFTPTHTFTASDTISGAVEHHGVWRWSHDFQHAERVDVGVGRYETGSQRSTAWTGVHADGHLIFGSYQQNEVAGYRHLELYAADEDHTGPGEWRELARIYTRSGKTCDQRGFWYNADTNTFGVCFGTGAGKQTQNETALFQLDGTYTDDYMGAAPGVGGNLYIPDTIHPVYWVGGSGASASAYGYDPDSAMATVQQALGGGTGAGAVTITSTSAAASYLCTVITATPHTYVAGSRVTITGNADAGLNGLTWVVYDVTDSTHFRIKVPSTITGGVGGTVNDTYSNVTYGGKVIVRGSAGVTQSFNVQFDKFPYNCTVSNVLGFAGESGHAIQISGQGIDSTTIYDSAALSGVGLMTLNKSGDWIILEDLTCYHTRAAASSRTINASAAGSKFWARDCQLGHASYSAQAWRNAATSDGDHYLWRNHIVGDTALGGVNQAGVEVDGTARVLMYGNLVETTYRGVRLRTDGTKLVMRGNTVRNFSQFGIDTVVNNAGSWDVRGNVVVSSNGSSAGVDSSTGTFTAGFATEDNFFERTPTRARDQGGTNISAQALGTTLATYFSDSDPRSGPVDGSPLIGRGGWCGPTDYSKQTRANPATMGHLEPTGPIRRRRVTARRLVA